MNRKLTEKYGTASGIEIIADARKHQIVDEGFTATNDLKYTDNELSTAAAVYADMANYHGDFTKFPSATQETAKVMLERDFKWPWDKAWLKLSPDDRVKELAKAGALISAEIDRELNECRISNHEPIIESQVIDIEALKTKADKWDNLDETIGKFYDVVFEDVDLLDVGEAAALALGYV